MQQIILVKIYEYLLNNVYQICVYSMMNQCTLQMVGIVSNWEISFVKHELKGVLKCKGRKLGSHDRCNQRWATPTPELTLFYSELEWSWSGLPPELPISAAIHEWLYWQRINFFSVEHCFSKSISTNWQMSSNLMQH